MSIPTPTYPGVTITRNQQGWPVIDAPNIQLAYEAFGYILATDRTWLLFDDIMTANGLAPSYRGPSAVPEAETILNYLYTEADFNAQFAQWSDISKNVMMAYTTGLNTRFALILAGLVPLPEQFIIMNVQPRTFSVYQVTNMLYNDLLSNLEVNLDAQLQSFFGYLGVAATNTPENTALIAADFLGVNGVTKARWSITEGESCNGDPLVALSNFTCCRASREHVEAVGKYINCRLLMRSYKMRHGHGSFAGVLRSGSEMISFGAPLNENVAPSVLYTAFLNTPDYLATNNSFVSSSLLISNESCIRNGCYAYNTSISTAYRSLRYYSIEPATNQVPYNTYTIEVRGAPSVTYTVYRSVTSGYVIGPFILPGSILVARSVNVNNAMVGIDPVIRLLFMQNMLDYPSFPNQTDVTSYNILFLDSNNNIGALLISNSVIPPAGVNGKIPLIASVFEPFLYVNPIRPISEFIVTPPSLSVNQRQFYVDWNGPWNSVPLDLSAPLYEYTRSWWIYHQLKTFDHISYFDLRDLIIKIADTKLFALGHGVTVETSEPRLNAQSDAFLLVKDRFALAIANNPTPLRLALLSELNNYDGSFIGGDNNNIITSPNVLDLWFLANSWLAQVVINILNPVMPLVINPGTTPWDTLFNAMSLIIRLLINPCNNPIFYTGYPGYNNPAQLDLIIANSLDEAYAQLLGFLGPRPWGTNLRYQFPVINEFAGVVATIPWILHGASDGRADLNTSGVQAHGVSLGPGVTDKIIITPTGVIPAPSMINLETLFEFFDIPEFGGKLLPARCLKQKNICPLKCHEKHKCFL